MILGGWRISWSSSGVGVVGVGAGRGLRLGGQRFRACHSWLVVGRLVVLVGGCLCCWGISFGCPWVCSGRWLLWVVGGVAVVPLWVVLVTVLVTAPPAELWVM